MGHLLPFDGSHEPQTVQDQIDNSAGYPVTFTVTGDVEAKTYDPLWVAHRDCSIVQATAAIGAHDAGTHPADGAPDGALQIDVVILTRSSGNFEVDYLLSGGWNGLQFAIENGEHFGEWDLYGGTAQVTMKRGDALRIIAGRPLGGAYDLGSNLTVHLWAIND